MCVCCCCMGDAHMTIRSRPPHRPLDPNPTTNTPTPQHTNPHQSARRIPTEEQRGIWLAYTRGKFREGQRLDDATRARRALEDGREQLGRMNYFHEVRERKEAMAAAKQEATAPLVGDGGAGYQYQHHRPPLGGDEQRQDIGRRGGNQQQHRFDDEPAASGEWDLLEFLQRSLPGAKSEDLARYEAELREEGFGDAPGMLGYLKEGDVAGWKKAHARAFLAAVRREMGGS